MARFEFVLFAAALVSNTIDAAPPRPSAWTGIVVDDESAEYTGQWKRSARAGSLVGRTYHHDDKQSTGLKFARFTPELPESGQYEVRLLYVAHANRATNVPVSIISEDGEARRVVNQREGALVHGLGRFLSEYRFAAGKKASVIVSTEGVDGFVVVDAVQFVPKAVAAVERAAMEQDLAKPADVRHTQSSPAHLRVEWKDMATAEAGYRIWRRKVGGDWFLAGESGPDSTHFDDGGMQQTTSYEHRVAAFDETAEGEASVTASATSTGRMHPHLKAEVVIPPGATFPASPAALMMKSGELLLAYQTGNAQRRRDHRNETIWIMSSRDGRSGWSKARPLLRGGAKTVYGKAALVRMPDGRIGMTFSRWICDDDGKIVGRSRQFIASADEGMSWSEPVDVGPMSANNHTLILGDDGRLLESLSGTTGVNDVFGSDDQGRTWRFVGRVPGKRLGEAALAHAGGGRIVYLSRHEWPFYRLSFSADNGVTWQPQASLLYLGGGDNPPKLTLLPDGTTLAAIVHSWHPGSKAKDRRQLASVISRDGGRTWDNFRLIGFAPDGEDGFLQHAIAWVGETAYLFYGGGSRLDTNDGKDLRLIKLDQDFFTSTTAWPYDWQGQPLKQGAD